MSDAHDVDHDVLLVALGFDVAALSDLDPGTPAWRAAFARQGAELLRACVDVDGARTAQECRIAARRLNLADRLDALAGSGDVRL